MRVKALLLLLLATCVGEPEGSIAEPVSQREVRACTVAPNARCSGSAERVACAELPSERGLEQLVCCPGVSAFVHRLCTGQPNSPSPCGTTGPAGCAVCNMPAPIYDDACAVSGGDDFLIGTYRDPNGAVHHVRVP